MKTLLLLTLAVFITTTAFSQRGPNESRLDPDKGERHMRGLDRLGLNEDQKEQIDGLKVKHRQSTKEDRDALKLKRVELENNATDESPDLKAIDKITDEIGRLQTALLKSKIAHRIEVRGLLTDEQKLEFDNMKRHKRKHTFGRPH